MNLEDCAVRDGVESCYTGMYLVVRVTRPEPIVIVNNIDVLLTRVIYAYSLLDIIYLLNLTDGPPTNPSLCSFVGGAGGGGIG